MEAAYSSIPLCASAPSFASLSCPPSCRERLVSRRRAATAATLRDVSGRGRLRRYRRRRDRRTRKLRQRSHQKTISSSWTTASRRTSARFRSSTFRCRPPARARPHASTVLSDVKSNAEPISGRLYVIVLDDLNVAPLRTKVVVNAARQLIERHFGPNDIAAITYTSGRTDGAQEFTSERAAAARSHRQVPGAEAALDRDREGRPIFSAALERARDKPTQPRRSRRPSGPPRSGTVRGPIGYSDITTDRRRFRARPPRAAGAGRAEDASPKSWEASGDAAKPS